jgi:hypothetical protein
MHVLLIQYSAHDQMLQAPYLNLSAFTLIFELKIYKWKKIIFGFFATSTGVSHLTYEFINRHKFIFDVLAFLTGNRFFSFLSFIFEVTSVLRSSFIFKFELRNSCVDVDVVSLYFDFDCCCL